ncbi:hypothetical protein BH10BAC2_BH10BAC2_37250 [soil metagenome]
MKLMIIACLLLILPPCIAQKNKTTIFKENADVGNPHIAGSAVFDPELNMYTLKGSGYNIWFKRDEFQYAYKKIKGDFVLTANFAFVGEGKDPHRKIGWMVRESLVDSGVHISAVAHGDGLTVMQWRVKSGMSMRDPEDEIFAKGKSYGVLQLERKGNTFIMRVAEREGQPFQIVGEHTMDQLQDKILAGIFICSHNADVLEEATVWNVEIKE